MRLTPAQVDAFERDGYLFFPNLFKKEEIQVLLNEVPALYADVPLPWKDGTPAEELQGSLKAA